MAVHATNKNNSKNKKTKYILEDALAVPNNPPTEEVEMVLPQKDDAMSYGESSAPALVTQTMKEEVSGTNQEVSKGMDSKSDMFSPWRIGTLEMGGATPPLQKQLKLKEEDKEMTLAEEALMMKSTPLHITWRGEKKKQIEEKGPTVALVIPMLKKLMKEGPQYIITSADWGKCMLYVVGQRKPSQLYSRQAIEAEIPLIEALDKLELLKGIEEADWEGFKSYTEHVATVYID